MSNIKDISYCVVTDEAMRITAKIKAWIEARQLEGWNVEFKVRVELDGQCGVIWQCVSHRSVKVHQEFTPCITMTGQEKMMN